MLGWMLGPREHAPAAVEDGDTGQIEQPDTPAPVFAARAFKSALFGTPASRSDFPSRLRAKSKSEPVAPIPELELGTPLKPQGILLTPGTGTNRRKRVSFNHEALTTTKSISPKESGRDSATKRTRLTEVMEKARRKSNDVETEKDDVPANRVDTDSDWEEEEEDFCTHDITLDLNEPHSQSGKYWKGEFERYRREAAAELEKLVKYKQRAKSYAREKDVEAMRLADRLREEQEKVIALEKKIAENAGQMAAKQRDSYSSETAELLATLTKQTALATESRHRVQELEERLDELLQGREDDNESKGRKRRTVVSSPAAQKTLLEVQRELRRARGQLKELDALREQVSSLKAQLKRAEQRDSINTVGNDFKSESSLVQELKAQLKQAQEESGRKDETLVQLKNEFTDFRKESEAHDADAKAVLERAHTKISDLKKEVKSLKAAKATEPIQPRSWHVRPDNDRLSKDDLSVELPMRHAIKSGVSRRSLDLAELDRPDMFNIKGRTLREKYREDDTDPSTKIDVIRKVSPEFSSDRSSLEKPRWQPFVPRSPRNRAYLNESLLRRIRNGSIGSTAKPRSLGVSDLPDLSKSIARSKRPGPVEKDDLEVDLLQDRFARLGGPEGDQSKARNTLVLSANALSTLAPERRAAARARIEKRMADKRAQRGKGYDKENVRP